MPDSNAASKDADAAEHDRICDAVRQALKRSPKCGAAGFSTGVAA